MKRLSLFENCIMKRFDKNLQNLCQDFSCGNSDLDDFFKNDAIKYSEDLMGKTYCWLTDTKPYKIVALVTLARRRRTALLCYPRFKTNPHKINVHRFNRQQLSKTPVTLTCLY